MVESDDIFYYLPSTHTSKYWLVNNFSMIYYSVYEGGLLLVVL